MTASLTEKNISSEDGVRGNGNSKQKPNWFIWKTVSAWAEWNVCKSWCGEKKNNEIYARVPKVGAVMKSTGEMVAKKMKPFEQEKAKKAPQFLFFFFQ